MMYRKAVFDGFIVGVGETPASGNIDKTEYDRLSAILATIPEAPEGYYYMLREDETWALIEKEPEPTDPDLTEAEAFNIIFGGGSE